MSVIPGITVNQTISSPPVGDDETVVPVFVCYLPVLDDAASPLVLLQNYDALTTLIPEGDDGDFAVAYQSLKLYFDNGGGPCYVLSPGRVRDVNTLASLLGSADFWQPVLNHPDITLLTLPVMSLFRGDKAEETATRYAEVWNKVLHIMLARRDIFCLIDAPRDLDAALAFSTKFKTDTQNGETLNYAAVYWPHLLTDYTDKQGSYTVLPPACAVAATMYKSDRDNGIWKAAANVELLHVIKPDVDMAHSQGFDYPTAVPHVPTNYVLSLPGMGTRVWGCRTLQTDAGKGLLFVQQRRLLTFIEHNMRELATFMLFEPNNALTWFKYKGIANDWLRELWHSGGLLGESEDQAWEVKLGLNESMTLDDLRHSRLVIDIKVKILNPIEFIDIQLRLSINQATPYDNAGPLTANASLS